MGPINNKMQLDRVSGLVEDAVKDGAKVVTGGARFDPTGKNPNSYFYKPTIVAGAKEGMRIVDEEQFGLSLRAVCLFRYRCQTLRGRCAVLLLEPPVQS